MPLPRSIQKIALEEPQLVRQERTLNKATVQDLLKAAYQKQQDTKVSGVSDPTRYEAAYDTALFASLALFAAAGYRIVAQAGHHRVALEGLAGTLGLSETTWDELELILEVRNSKYTGFLNVKPADLKLALGLAEDVLQKTVNWLQANNPTLLKTS